MKPGSTKLILSIFLLFFYSFPSQSEDKILSSPLINLKKLKPSFEGIDNSTNDTTNVNKIKNRISNLIAIKGDINQIPFKEIFF